MKTQFEQMMAGLNDVEAFLAGEQEGFKAHVSQEVDLKAIRNRLGMQATPESLETNTPPMLDDLESPGRDMSAFEQVRDVALMTKY